MEVKLPYIKGADVASAATLNLDTATGDLVDVTGTTTITAVTLTEGRECTVRFTEALVLTAGVSLILPAGASNITTAAGDIGVFRGYASGVVRCIIYQRKDGTSLSIFPAGTRMLFHQTAAPTGWTKDTATANLNDGGLRTTTGAVSPGGTVAFSTVFGTARTTSATAPGSTDGFTLTAGEIPSHTHNIGAFSANLGSGSTVLNADTTAAGTVVPASTGGGGSHAHTHATTHTHTSNLNVYYQDVIIASKD
jgi:hypothetical protein